MAAVTASLGLVLAVASGCSGEPEPVETTPGFATEEEAFAAGEETYRAYVDALNQVDLADPATFEPVFALTTGEANASFRSSFSQQHAEGWTVTGASQVTVIEPVAADGVNTSLAVCLDVSRVEVRDATGASVIDPDRRDVQPMRVTVTLDGRWLISDISSRRGEPQCDAAE